MKKVVALFCMLMLHSHFAFAKDLRGFLVNCAWGTLGGATAGVVSLAFVDKPSESWGNVAKGASLGLYAGIAYGLVRLEKESTTEGQADFAVFPQFHQGQVEGLQLAATLLRF